MAAPSDRMKSMVKQYVKRCVVAATSTLDGAVLVNSYGRSGSTMLTNAIALAAAGNGRPTLVRLRARAIRSDAWDLNTSRLRPGFVYKTHDYPPTLAPRLPIRVLYVFSNPVDVVLSLIRLYEQFGDGPMRLHYEHLRAPYGDFDGIASEDQLGLEAHFDRWLGETRFPVAFVRYEDLWQRQREVEEFLELSLALPPRRPRETMKADPVLERRLAETYLSLGTKVRDAEGFRTNSARVGKGRHSRNP